VRSERFQLDFPDDFPTRELEAVHAHLTDTGDDRPQTDEWSQWAGACNGLSYRFLALDELAAALSSSLDDAIAPPMPERYRQERLLFSFFAEGHSCLECFYYGFYFVGAMIDQRAFDPNVDPRLVNAGLVVRQYLARFSAEPLAASMQVVHESATTKEWREIRNVLAHRSAPARGFYVEENWADWMGGMLSGDGVRERRAWISETLRALLAPAVGFVLQQLPAK
jgi:hypothetical protein